MKVMPTLEGGLRIEAENAGDWLLIGALPEDAGSGDSGLAQRLGAQVTDEEVAEDWREFVVPDLAKAFSTDVEQVTARIAGARLDAGGEAGPLWIPPDDADAWYSTLNQARLALEEQYSFGQTEQAEPSEFPPLKRSAFMRSHFYCAIQSLLLEHVMK